MPQTALLWAGAVFLGAGFAALFVRAGRPGAIRSGAVRRFCAAGPALWFAGCAALFVYALAERHLLLAAAAFLAALLLRSGVARADAGGKTGGSGARRGEGASWRGRVLHVRAVLSRRGAGKAAALFAACVALVLLVRHLPHVDEDALARFVLDKGHAGMVLYVAATALLSAAGVPRQGLSFAGGYAFGAAFGLVLSTLGTALGCATGFFLARRFGKPFVPRRFAKRMERLDAFIAQAPFSMTLTVRCLPFGNNALTNILAGVSSIPAGGFIAGSCVGYIPQNFIFALLGSGIRVDPFWRVCIAALLFLLASLLGLALFSRHRASFAEEEKKH
ncbi:MAG: VTT domain-containing protein [Deltaproteobacteria bacterium]|jgi:uncharacterized membrane protein YdjX (TVP38/TMEM64 family)|nr:VTT domain-containing protein [Deltaproteobacteria bacterium]